MKVMVTQRIVNYDTKLNVTGASYSTTLPLDTTPLEIAYEVMCIIAQDIGGDLSGLSADIGQNCYSFSVSGEPKNIADKQFTIDIDLNELGRDETADERLGTVSENVRQAVTSWFATWLGGASIHDVYYVAEGVKVIGATTKGVAREHVFPYNADRHIVNDLR